MVTRRGFGRLDKLPSGNWRARYAGPDGKVHKASHTFVTKEAADYWAETERRLISDGTWTPPEDRARRPAPITLESYAALVLERRATRTRRPLRPLTRQDYDKLLRLHILPALGDMPLRSINPEAVRSWYDHAAPGHATTRGKAYELLRSIMADAETEGLVDANPCRIVGAGKPNRHKAVDALPAGVLLAYLDAADDHYRPMLAIAATCALRSGELRGLRRRDVEVRSGVIHVRQQVIKRTVDHHRVYEFADLKTEAGHRDVAVPAFLVPILKEWLADLPMTGRDGLVFPARDGRSPMNDSVLNKAHKKAAAAIGRPNLTVHDLRRTAATLAAQGGSTTREVMRMLGHTRPDVAMLYQVADDERDRARADRLDAALDAARAK